MATAQELALAEAIRHSWSAETTVDCNWSSNQPSKGQCAVTALVVQDYFGGAILRATVSGVSHYWNRLSNGTIIDLTRDQFSSFDPTEIEPRTRRYILSYAATAARYRILSERVRRRLVMERVGVGTKA
jgi:hypothetical protein